MSREEELAYKRGFDAGSEHQKKSDPPPKARDLQKQLEKVRDELAVVHEEYRRLTAALEEMRLRAEGAEARIASVSGVTREELAKREYERGLAEGREVRAEMLAALDAVLKCGVLNDDYLAEQAQIRAAIANARRISP
ncbi:MAG: hypothetical protein ACOZQL_10790 [Myxococcota bacterium]